MSIRTNASLALLLLSALAGCSAESGSDTTEQATAPLAPAAGTEEANGEAAASEIAEISIAGSTITLSQVSDGDAPSAILVSEHFDMSRGSVLQRLTAERDMTSLEIFVSLKPEATAPAALYELHAAEAHALGRADESVLTAAFDANALVEKAWSAADCDAYVFNNEGPAAVAGTITYSNKQRLNNVSGSHDLYVGPSPTTGTWTTKDVNLGVCNNGAAAMNVELWSIKQGASWVKNWDGDALPNHALAWRMIYLGNIDDDCDFEPGDLCGGEPCLCIPVREPAAYAVRGNGTNFRSRTAEGLRNRGVIR
jgi:hypothetical protein